MKDSMYILIGHYNRLFTDYFEANNINYYIIKDSKRHAEADVRSVVIDFQDTDAIVDAIASLPMRPSCIFTMYEQYIPITAEINRRLGNMSALSPEAARASTDKVLMRQAFATAPEPISPPFTLVTTHDEAAAFAETHGFPVILKPANLSKSLLISRCDNREQLDAAWREAIAEAPRLYQKLTNGLAPRFILESFMPGSVHTVLGYADKDGVVTLASDIVDNVTAQEAGFEDSFIFSRTIPSALPAATQEAILHCSRMGMQALGLRSCAAHIEIILTAQGPRLIEIGARVGGYRTVMYQEASGIDVVAATLAAYDGKRPDLTPLKRAFYRAIEIFPDRKGSFKGIDHFDTASALHSIMSARIKYQPGALAGKAAQGFKAAAVFELSNDSESQIQKDYEYIRQHVQARVA